MKVKENVTFQRSQKTLPVSAETHSKLKVMQGKTGMTLERFADVVLKAGLEVVAKEGIKITI